MRTAPTRPERKAALKAAREQAPQPSTLKEKLRSALIQNEKDLQLNWNLQHGGSRVRRAVANDYDVRPSDVRYVLLEQSRELHATQDALRKGARAAGLSAPHRQIVSLPGKLLPREVGVGGVQRLNKIPTAGALIFELRTGTPRKEAVKELYKAVAKEIGGTARDVAAAAGRKIMEGVDARTRKKGEKEQTPSIPEPEGRERREPRERDHTEESPTMSYIPEPEYEDASQAEMRTPTLDKQEPRDPSVFPTREERPTTPYKEVDGDAKNSQADHDSREREKLESDEPVPPLIEDPKQVTTDELPKGRSLRTTAAIEDQDLGGPSVDKHTNDLGDVSKKSDVDVLGLHKDDTK
jgi:hypothetical protein